MPLDRLLADFDRLAADEEDPARRAGLDSDLESLLRDAPRTAPTVPLPEAGGGGSRYLAFAARLGLPIAGSVLGALSPIPGGTYLGGGAGAAAGEALAEWIEGRDLDPREIALQGGVGAVPFAGRARTLAGGALLRGAQGAALGGAQEVAREWLHGEDLDPRQIAEGAAAGGLLGAAAGGLEGAIAARQVRAAQAGAAVVSDLAEQRAQQAAIADRAYRETTDELLGTLPPSDRALYDAYREGRVQLLRPDGTPFDAEQFARLEAVRAQHEDATRAWEAAKGWTPEQQGAARAAAATAGLDPMAPPDEALGVAEAAYREGLDEGEQAALRRRRLATRTPGDELADQAFERADHQRTLAADAAAVEQIAQATEPTLGQLGLPAAGDTPTGALSAADPDRLAPSIVDLVDSPESLKSLMHDLAQQSRDAIGDARRGVQTRAQREAAARPIIAELADRLGTDPDSFTAGLRKRGEAVNAEQMEALKTVLNGAKADFWLAAQEAIKDPTNVEAQVRAAKAMAIARSLVLDKAGASAEAARTLAVLRKAEQTGGLQGAALEKLLRDADPTAGNLAEVLRRAALLESPDEAEKLMFQATREDKLLELYTNGLLSGTRTQVVNNVSNATTLGLRLPEEVTASMLDAMNATITGTRRQRFVGEAVADTLGMARGLVGGARAALRAFDTELSTAAAGGKVEARRHAIAGRTGRFVRVPSRLLLMADEFWKSVSIEGSVYAQAYREAAQAGLRGGRRLERMGELLTTERARLVEAAKPEALYRTFQSKGGPGTRALLALRNAPVPHLGIHPGRVLMPFVKTPLNIIGMGLERTPVGVIPLLARAARGELGDGEAADRIARMLVGTGVAGATVSLMAQGRITGAGPRDPAQRNALLASGWQPYSFRFGNQYIKYDRIEPIGTVLGLAADAYDLLHDPLVAPEDVAMRLAFGFAQRLSDQSFFTGIREVLDALDDERKAGGYLKRLAASTIPTILAHVTQATDPVARRQRALSDRLMARLPGLSQMVLPLRDIWGREITRPSGAEAMFSPFPRSPARTDAASQEVGRLARDVGLGLSAPAASITIQGVLTPLSEADYDTLSVRAGQLAHAAVTKLVTSPGYARLRDDQRKAELIEGVVTKARARARDDLKRALILRQRVGARR